MTSLTFAGETGAAGARRAVGAPLPSSPPLPGGGVAGGRDTALTRSYTYTHTHIHTYTPAYTRTRSHTHAHTHAHTYKFIYAHTDTRTHTYVHTHTFTDTHIRSYTPIYIRTHTYSHVHTHIHKHTHALTHPGLPPPAEPSQAGRRTGERRRARLDPVRFTPVRRLRFGPGGSHPLPTLVLRAKLGVLGPRLATTKSAPPKPPDPVSRCCLAPLGPGQRAEPRGPAPVPPSGSRGAAPTRTPGSAPAAPLRLWGATLGGGGDPRCPVPARGERALGAWTPLYPPKNRGPVPKGGAGTARPAPKRVSQGGFGDLVPRDRGCGPRSCPLPGPGPAAASPGLGPRSTPVSAPQNIPRPSQGAHAASPSPPPPRVPTTATLPSPRARGFAGSAKG